MEGRWQLFGQQCAGTGVVRRGTTVDLEKAGMRRISIVRKEKNSFPGIENGYEFNNYFVRKMRSIKPRKGRNGKNWSWV